MCKLAKNSSLYSSGSLQLILTSAAAATTTAPGILAMTRELMLAASSSVKQMMFLPVADTSAPEARNRLRIRNLDLNLTCCAEAQYLNQSRALEDLARLDFIQLTQHHS